MTLLHGPCADPAYKGNLGYCDAGGRGGCRKKVNAAEGYYHCDPCKGDACKGCLPDAAVPVHYGIECDDTGMKPIIGSRYKKLNENYDLCQEAFDKLSEKEAQQFVQIDATARGVWKRGVLEVDGCTWTCDLQKPVHKEPMGMDWTSVGNLQLTLVGDRMQGHYLKSGEEELFLSLAWRHLVCATRMLTRG